MSFRNFLSEVFVTFFSGSDRSAQTVERKRERKEKLRREKKLRRLFVTFCQRRRNFFGCLRNLFFRHCFGTKLQRQKTVTKTLQKSYEDREKKLRRQHNLQEKSDERRAKVNETPLKKLRKAFALPFYLKTLHKKVTMTNQKSYEDFQKVTKTPRKSYKDSQKKLRILSEKLRRQCQKVTKSLQKSYEEGLQPPFLKPSPSIVVSS